MQLLVAHIVEPLLTSSRAALLSPRWQVSLPTSASRRLNYRSRMDVQTFHCATRPTGCDLVERHVGLHANDNSRPRTKNLAYRRYHRHLQCARLSQIARTSNAS